MTDFSSRNVPLLCAAIRVTALGAAQAKDTDFSTLNTGGKAPDPH